MAGDERSNNGHADADADADDEGDLPLDDDELAAGAAAADEAVTETLAERVASVIGDLEDVERRPDPVGDGFLAGGRLFAVVGEDRLEAALDPRVATAALRTPDTAPSRRGAGWITFAPVSLDRFALDRAEAWVRSAHRRVTTGA
jgi:hypothetical protein